MQLINNQSMKNLGHSVFVRGIAYAQDKTLFSLYSEEYQLQYNNQWV